MSRTRTWKLTAVVAAAAGIIITTSIGGAEAKEIYSDETVGISTTFDMYAQTLVSQTETATTTDASEETTETAASEDTAEAVTEEEKQVRYPEFEGRCIAVPDDYVNIRAEGSTDAETVGTLARNGLATVVESGSEWTRIQSGDCDGYIRNDFLLFGDDAGEYAETNCSKVATVTTETLNVRAEADSEADCVTLVGMTQSFDVLSQTDGWVEIQVDDSVTGYVSDEYVDVDYDFATAKTMEQIQQEYEEQQRKLEEQKAAEEAAKAEQSKSSQTSQTTDSSTSSQAGTTSAATSTTSAATTGTTTAAPATTTTQYAAPSGQTGIDLANFALQFVGNPYVYGGSSLTNGADCSGFVMSVYAQYGYSLPHRADLQANYGTRVDLSALEPGDIVFYGSGSNIGHCAIYVGGGTVVHASSPETGIKTSGVNYRTPICAVRLIGQ